MVRVLLLIHGTGFLTGDEVEVLEEAARRGCGLEFRPWEIRNTLLPDLLVAPFSALGCRLPLHPMARLWLAHAPFLLLSVLNVYLVHALARRLLREPRWAWVAAALYATLPLTTTYGSTAHPRVAATTLFLLAHLWWTRAGDDRSPGRSVGAGALMAVAFACRYSEVLFLAALAVWVSMARGGGKRWVAWAGLAAGFGLGSLVAVGLWDWWTWGAPFSSLREFAAYTLVDRESSSLVAEQGAVFYLRRLHRWLPLTLLPFSRRRWDDPSDRGLLAGLLLALLALSAIHHKEIRYLQLAMPWLAILAAGGFGAWWNAGWRRTALALLVISMLFGVVRGTRVLADRSAPALEASLDLARRDGVRAVALSQAWAYGDRLLLGNEVEVVELGLPVEADRLRDALPTVQAAAFYARELERPELLRALRDQGFEELGRHSGDPKREVTVWGKVETE